MHWACWWRQSWEKRAPHVNQSPSRVTPHAMGREPNLPSAAARRLMLLGRSFRVVPGSAHCAGVIRSDTFPEPPDSLPGAHGTKRFPCRGASPSPPSRTQDLLHRWAAQKKHKHLLCIRLCLCGGHKGLGRFSWKWDHLCEEPLSKLWHPSLLLAT